MVVLYLIESEAVPARYNFKQIIELMIFGENKNKYRNLEHKIRVNNIKKSKLFLQKNINLPLFVFTNRQKEEIKQDNCFDYITIKAVIAERKKN